MGRLIAIGTFASLLFAACGTQPPPTEHKGLIISVTDAVLSTGGTDTVRFGHMHSGEIAQLRFRLSNQTSRPVVVTTYERTCGCTTLDFDNQPINPGQTQQMTLTFDSRGESGWQLKMLDIRLAGAQRPVRLFIEADVE